MLVLQGAKGPEVEAMETDGEGVPNSSGGGGGDGSALPLTTSPQRPTIGGRKSGVLVPGRKVTPPAKSTGGKFKPTLNPNRLQPPSSG